METALLNLSAVAQQNDDKSKIAYWLAKPTGVNATPALAFNELDAKKTGASDFYAFGKTGEFLGYYVRVCDELKSDETRL